MFPNMTMTQIMLFLLLINWAIATDPRGPRTVDMRVQFEIMEELPPGTFVGKIPTRPGFTYRVNEDLTEFTLNATTGEIRTAKIIDRESLSQEGAFDFVVLSSLPKYPVEVRILILDVNDFSPIFPEPEVQISFPESATVGTRVFLDPAEDADVGINDVTEFYEIIDGNEEGHFKLDVTPNPSGEAPFLHLETTGRLDRESIGNYRLNISARDGGSPPRFGFLIVNVNIIDQNDCPPIFDHSDYVVSLNESVEIGTPVLLVTASDNDEGDNAKITYYLAETETQFTVDAETGEIFTAQTLNCQQNCPSSNSQGNCPKSCVFTVFARDHGVPRQDGRTYVTVNLLATNSHDPIIRFRYFPPTAESATVDENAAIGSVVAAISVIDLDEGLNGETTLKITSGNDLAHFRLESTPSFQLIRVNSILDREKIGSYNLSISVADKGFPPRSSSAFMVIQVNDVNDHPPIYESTEYSAILRELVPIGSFVINVLARDEDTGINALVFYSIASGNERGWFTIDPVSGLITTAAPLDRESEDTVRLEVSARDGGPNPKWAQTQVKIVITDENDEIPRFAEEEIVVQISEEAAIGSIIATVSAKDSDQGTNGSISYHLGEETEDLYPGQFHLDSSTGKIFSRAKFDAETNKEFKIQVIARDHGSPSLESTANVFLTLMDINNHNPIIYPVHYFVPIERGTPVNSRIVQIHASDKDEDSKLFFSIESGDQEFLSLNELTGEIGLKKDLRELVGINQIIQISVSVRDGDGRKCEEHATVEILVKSPKLQILKFKKDLYNMTVVEDYGPPGSKGQVGEFTEIGKVELQTSSSSTNRDFKFSILTGDQGRNFKLDEISGILKAGKKLDRETKSEYSLTILARSPGDSVYAVCLVQVHVLDLNDNSAVFERKRVKVELEENSALGTEVFQTLAVDLDLGENSTLTYSLVKNPNEMFSIDTANGLITLSKRLDFSEMNKIQIEVLAKDKGPGSLSSKQFITVHVLDINNFTPAFDHSSYETSLSESTPVNERFFSIKAKDQDFGLNALITYKIEDGNDGNVFGVFPDGFIYVKSGLDRETQDYFSLKISATDQGVPPRSSTVSVVINVIDENDMQPRFTNSTFTFTIDENEPPDTYIGQLTATDLDVGRNAQLKFICSSPDFIIGAKNGFVRTAKSFDREALAESGQDSITFEVIVHDGGKIPMEDRAIVVVFVKDINDHSPVFSRNAYATQISEGTPVGAAVLRVFATDLDEGLNRDIFYYLENDFFKIDGITGQITLAKSLDRETQDQYKLSVIAKDLGSNPLSSTVTVDLTILDENDCSPEFTQSESHISISEMTPVNTELIRFQATDPDLGLNQQVVLSIAPHGNRHEVFRIDPKTGIIYLNKPLDFERTTSYKLNVTASDMGNPKLSSAIEFTVDVLDFNDNHPVFPSTAIVRQVQEGIPVGTPIVTVTADDPDSGLNAEVRYSISDQEPPGHFGINSEKGLIYTTREIDREFADTYKIMVVATDQALPEKLRLTSEKLVSIFVEDLNDCDPVFSSLNAAVLNRSYSEGSEIIRIQANDADSESNGQVTYEMTSGDSSLFSLDRTTGSIRLKKKLTDLQPRYQLTIRATDEAIQSQRKSADFYLTIVSSGESSRVKFSNYLYKSSVAENEPIGTSVLSVSAEMDAGFDNSAEIEYYITNITSTRTGEMQERIFDIDLRKGLISTTRLIDREVGVAEYSLEVYAVLISAHGIHTAKSKVQIEILDKNDSPPQFLEKKIRLNVSESAPVGFQIAALTAKDPDTIGSVSYSILQGDGGKFNLNTRTGVLSVLDILDRETTEKYKIIVRANDGVQFTDTTVIVKVTDSNDHPPTFSSPTFSFDVPEDAPHGQIVGELRAVDPDIGVNGVVTYSVLSDWGNDVFSLNPQTGVFTLATKLDYEEVQHYIFVIQAQDAGTPSLSSTATVYVNVVDVNDCAAVFDSIRYNKEVSEDVAVGTSIIAVSATDMDSGANGKLSYKIVSGDEGLFSISPENGTIFTLGPLDRETKSSYSLLVHALDHGSPSLSTPVHVGIVLKDVNEAPQFISPNQTYLMENSLPNTVVLVVKAIDLDEGKNGYVEYGLTRENNTFTIGALDGVLRVIGRIDRETRQNYTLHVIAKDRGEPPKHTLQKLVVQIRDENDHSPEFDSRQYSAAIQENSSVGLSILQVTASDLDEGLNSQLEYSIVSGDENRDFSIGASSGILRVAKNLNYERKTNYVLTIRVEDSGEKVLFDTATVKILVKNINNIPPVFLNSPYLAFVRENMVTNGTTVLRVEAFDADSPQRELRYHMKDGDKKSFRVNSATGEISVLRALDREEQSEYHLTIAASDAGIPRLTGTGTVQIVVKDVNDCYPGFSEENFEFEVKENVPVGKLVGKIIATDKDDGMNAQITYHLHGSSPFTINKHSGEIFTQGEIDRETQDMYKLVVTASDSNPIQALTSKTNVTIRIIDINDFAPIFDSNRFSITVPDNLAAGGYVFGASASDKDSGLNSKIRYYIGGHDADKFTISQSTGVVKALKNLRSIGKNTFNLEIHATDSALEDPMSSMMNVEVHLASEKKFPRIRTGVREFTFSEDTKNDFVTTIDVIPSVGKRSRRRRDSSRFNFYIGGGNLGNAFEIGETSGRLQISPSGLDYELTQNYELWIEVGSTEYPDLRSSVAFHINVTDKNDNFPVWEKSVYHLSVMEEEAWPKLIATLKAHDVDSGENGKVKYQLSRTTSETLGSLFSLEPNSGKLYTKVKLDREEIAQYVLTVEAVDHGLPSLTGTATLIVNVDDKNDNPPRFTRLFSVNVTENAPIGTFLIRVTSSDKDIGSNANCTYSFTGNNENKFSIDPNSGNITLTGFLDRETQDEYQVKVAAIDGSWRAETLVTISVQDENDESPLFEHSFYSFNIPEGDTVSFIGQVTASDRDKKGPNSQISYGLKHPSEIFTVNAVSGEIFSKKPLTYKKNLKKWSPENEFNLIVTATDFGKPPTSSECSITINVVDNNNHPPAFEYNSYFIPVNSSSSIGSKVIQLRAKDPDDFGVNSEVEYFAIGGNGSELFSIDKMSGWIKTTVGLGEKKLKTYVLEVRAIDKGIPPLQADTKVVLAPVGRNLFVPVFSADSFRVIVPENEAIGTVIVTATATDADEGANGKLQYNITAGNEERKFGIDPMSGVISIKQELDFDTKNEYELKISVRDFGIIPFTSEAQLMVMLNDINDLPPRFIYPEKMNNAPGSMYTATIKENSPIGSIVTKLTAVDKDSPKFSIIHFSIIGGTGKTLFNMNKTTGIISTKKIFDFEERQSYTLEVLASNPDNLNLLDSTTVQIQVEGVNEFYPKFLQPVFHFTISEAAAIGSIVGSVQATDEDSGNDGIVLFLFVGSSMDKGFRIDPKSGAISISKRLDRESQSRIVLTVLAKNIGSIRGNDTDEAQVVITVQDGNDPPVFEKSYYAMEVVESAPIGTMVGMVKATDIDVRPSNNRFSYLILGSGNDTFRIDPVTGAIFTTRLLDRETEGKYLVTIGAADVGEPPQTGKTTLQVTVLDINDNGPILSTVEGSIGENEPPKSKVMTLHATDPDLSPNGEPFTFTLVGGDVDKFKINPKSGLITSTMSFDRESTPILKINVEVRDSGSPQMKTTQEVRIHVTDKNDNPSLPRKAKLIFYTFGDEIPTEKIATLEPIDPDTTGQYTCHLEKSDTFSIPSSCNLHIKKRITSPQSLVIRADDGKHAEVSSTFTIESEQIDNQTVQNSVVIRAYGITPKKFLESVYTHLIEYLKQITLFTPHVYNLIQTENGTDVILTFQSWNNEKVENIASTLENHRVHIRRLFGDVTKNIQLNYSPCNSGNNCLNNAQCTSYFKPSQNSRRIIDSDALILSAPKIEQEFSCKCSSGFTGTKCELKTEPCQPNPCSAGSTCTKIGLDFQCSCPAHLHGKRCELTRSNVCESNPCKNGGSCQESRNDGSYFCLCRPGFFGGQCQTAADACRPNPCHNGGECLSSFGSEFPTCKCGAQYYGRYCEKSSFGFGFNSFMDFPALDPNTNDIAITFSTNKENSLLAYNFGVQTGGRSDFVAIQLVRGKPILSFGGARTAIATVTVDKYLADSKWYRVVAIRNGRVISLSVSICEESGENCKDCSPGDSECYADDVGLTGTLSFNSNPLHIGGLRDVNAMLERPGQVRTNDFIGCIHSIDINGRNLNLSSPLDSRFISDTCGRVSNVCENKCGSEGQCIDNWDNYSCRCSGILAPNCDEALSPMSFSPGSSLEFRVGENYRRVQLLQNFYQDGSSESGAKAISLSFRTIRNYGILFYAATNKDYTVIEISEGNLKYKTRIGSNPLVEIYFKDSTITDGEWHTFKLTIQNQLILALDGEKSQELSSDSVHDFLDPYLTILMLGSGDGEILTDNESFEGCMANFTIGNKLQPMRDPTDLFDELIQYGQVTRGCITNIATASAPDPLSIGVTLVIIFFVILLIAIFVSFFVFRLRNREKSPLPMSASRQTPSQTDVVRNHHTESESDTIKNFVRNSKKTTLGYHKPDIIERTISQHMNGNGSPLKDSTSSVHEHGISMEPDLPEHYDLENASSIAPSDIDIVYHYKGFRDNLGSKSTSPFRHTHFPGSRQSPGIRSGLQVATHMKSTPLARLSPSSELSQQTTPRILTLQDISGKPLQSALLGSDQRPDASQSERSLNISPTSSRRIQPKKKRKKHVQNIRIGLTAEEIDRLNHSRHKNNSSLVSTLDAVSSSDSNNGRKNKLDELANAELRRNADSSSGEESPHDSFSCSEFEYDKRRPHRMFSKLAEGENGEAESFRGSLSTLVASDDDLAYIGFNGKNVNSADRRSAGETWDYLLNWGPNYSPLANVFKDIAELPESSSACLPDDPGSGSSGMNNLNNVVARNSRYPTPRPNEEYV